MRKQIVSLAAVAALALVGVGAATTTAQAAPQEIKISEVLAQTNPAANPLGAKIDGVEIAKPSDVSLNGYRIQACDATGGVPADVVTLDTRSDDLEWTAASNQTSQYDYDFDSGAALDREGGVRLIDGSNNVVDAVAFTNASAVDTCLKSGDSTPPTPDQTLAPTDISSPQRQDAGTSDDTGTFTPSAPPSFQPMSGSPNPV